MNLVLATKNKGKIREIRSTLNISSLIYKSLEDFPQVPDILEDGASFLENALKKARTISHFLKLPVLADDSGLVVDALQGAPGIFSARFSGPGATDEANNEKLLTLLKEIPEEKRTARFVCCLVFHDPSGQWVKTEGSCEGIIAPAPRGDHGFGYDPVFYLPEFQKTMAQLPLETKNQISHRAKALGKMRPQLLSLLDQT